MKQEQLKARAIIAVDLYHEGRITRPEAFRLEMDAALGRDSGPITYESNREHEELLEEDEEYRRRFEEWKTKDKARAAGEGK